ncbi:hypothetical protein N9L68_04785 [bacterium]|nr:hypothetical protein [bacterium]
MDGVDAPGGSCPKPGDTLTHLWRLTTYKNKAGDVSSVLAWDDLTNMRLEAGKVVEARNKDIEYVGQMRVYDKIPRTQAMRNGWRIIKTRLIFINKGDDDRFVGKEFNNDIMEGLFAGTPPLEAFRYLIHEAATVRVAEEPMGSKVLMINDVSRAFSEAPATRDICVELPPEDVTDAERRHEMVGRLRSILYGTRDAATHWQEEVAKEMIKARFKRGKYIPCLYFQEGRNLRTFLHGDDIATVGTKEEVKWLKDVLEKRLEINTNCVSPAAARLGGSRSSAASGPSRKTTNGAAMQEGSESRLLNWVVRCTLEGWEVEPDQRHADLILQDLMLSRANGLRSPGANYLAADRLDLMYAVKVLCLGMARPTKLHWHKLKRLGRCLVEHGRITMRYNLQGHEPDITGHSESDWAGCRVTGKSTSGGALMIGGQFIKGWARTQTMSHSARLRQSCWH